MTTSAEAEVGSSARGVWSEQPKPKGAVRAVVLLACLMFLCHFAATAVYVMPLNPLKLSLSGLLAPYMNPYFVQGWELFAPDPLIKSNYLHVSCRLADGSEHGPYDATQPLYDARNRSRISGATWLFRAQHAALSRTNPRKTEFDDAVASFEDNPDPRLRKAAQDILALRQRNSERDIHIVTRLASVECDRIFLPRRTTHVRADVVMIEAPPFSTRNEPGVKGKSYSVDMPWAPYQQVDRY